MAGRERIIPRTKPVAGIGTGCVVAGCPAPPVPRTSCVVGGPVAGRPARHVPLLRTTTGAPILPRHIKPHQCFVPPGWVPPCPICRDATHREATTLLSGPRPRGHRPRWDPRVSTRLVCPRLSHDATTPLSGPRPSRDRPRLDPPCLAPPCPPPPCRLTPSTEIRGGLSLLT